MDPVTIPLTFCPWSDGVSIMVHAMKTTTGNKVHRTIFLIKKEFSTDLIMNQLAESEFGF